MRPGQRFGLSEIDGTWKDNSLNCTLKFEKHESIALSGMLKGEIFAGEFKTEGMQGTWEAKRGGTKAIGHMVAKSNVSGLL
jgi:hypothetical protein